MIHGLTKYVTFVLTCFGSFSGRKNYDLSPLSTNSTILTLFDHYHTLISGKYNTCLRYSDLGCKRVTINPNNDM